ncbi:MAG: prenyltransferase/squalene oxidase repeat-containing protein [Planctomycetota bacterium]
MSTQNVIPTVPPIANGATVPNGASPPVAVAIPVVAPPVVAAPVVAAAVAVPPAAAAVPPVAAAVAPAVPVPQPVVAVAQSAPQPTVPAPAAAPAPVVAAVPATVAAPVPPAVVATVPTAVTPPAAPQPAAPAVTQPAAKPTAPRPAKPMITLAPRLGRKTVDWKTLSTTIMASAGFHALALLACTFIVIQNPQLLEEIFTEVTENKEIVDEPIVEQALEQPNQILDSKADNVDQQNATDMVFEKGPVDVNISDAPVAQLKAEGNAPGLADIKFDNAASGRMSAAAKKALVRTEGGNSASEAAVAYGMRWLSKHQFPDGGWSFDHDAHADCKGQCSQAGTLKGGGRTGATGFALLAFLGGGHTHQNGEYQKEVKNGVEYLLRAAKQTPQGLDLCPEVVANEKMYVHGMCTIALSELAALTKDNRVKAAATGAVNFIVTGQNPKTGGWRYTHGTPDPGDTSVVGWQIMALKSAKNAKLTFPASSFKGAEQYLNAAQVEGGSKYVYDLNQKTPTPTMTAAALLCRMYLGWDRKNKALQEGVKYLAATKPQPNNMYYNYYATQVMHHWGGDEWTTWNSVMRDQLIRTQKTGKDGHMQGSWDLADPHGAVGGRLYMTCLSVMTLEVYYRHLPIYRREGLKVEF